MKSIIQLTKQYRSLILGVITSITLMLIGYVALTRHRFFDASIALLVILYIALSMINHLICFYRNHLIKDFVYECFYAILLLIIISNPILLLKTFNITVGVYAVLYGLIRYFDYYALRKNADKGVVTTLFISLISIVLGIIMVIFNNSFYYIINIITGFYFIAKGIVDLYRIVFNELTPLTKNKVYQRLSISTPVILSALLPIRMYADIKKITQKHHYTLPAIENQQEDSIEIWIHLNSRGFEQFGHVDISYQNVVYSYGCHDPNSREIFGSIGKGVLIVVDRAKFLQFCIDSNELVLIYTLRLNQKGQQIIKGHIDKILENTQEYTCNAKQQQLNHESITANDYASRVYKATDANMYTFTQGRFKTYYVFRTNCVLLADSILRNDQFNLIQVSGLVTPGSYISYLQQEYKSNHGYVTDVNVYYK